MMAGNACKANGPGVHPPAVRSIPATTSPLPLRVRLVAVEFHAMSTDAPPRSPEALTRAILEEMRPQAALVPGLIAFLEERLRFWALRTWRVGLLGITSAGKSTVVNGLFGEALLPARVKPSSNVLILSRRGPGPRTRRARRTG